MTSNPNNFLLSTNNVVMSFVDCLYGWFASFSDLFLLKCRQ